MGASIAYIKTKNLEKNYSLLLDKYAENKKIIAIVKRSEEHTSELQSHS